MYSIPMCDKINARHCSLFQFEVLLKTLTSTYIANKINTIFFFYLQLKIFKLFLSWIQLSVIAIMIFLCLVNGSLDLTTSMSRSCTIVYEFHALKLTLEDMVGPFSLHHTSVATPLLSYHRTFWNSFHDKILSSDDDIINAFVFIIISHIFVLSFGLLNIITLHFITKK